MYPKCAPVCVDVEMGPGPAPLSSKPLPLHSPRHSCLHSDKKNCQHRERMPWFCCQNKCGQAIKLLGGIRFQALGADASVSRLE
jgi:hypothetical protein